MRSPLLRNFVFGLAALIVLAFAMTNAPSALYRHYSGQKFIVGRDGGVRTAESIELDRARKKAAQVSATGPAPKAVAPDPKHDFGTMDPLTMGRHQFVIRNEGDAPLILEQGPTTCKCTFGNVSNNTIKPGETGFARLEWNTGRHAEYAHSAVVLTNDPRRRQIRFRVEGIVRKDLAIDPPKLTASEIEPNSVHELGADVYTQISSKLELVESSCSLEGVTCRAEPMTARQRTSLQAKAGLRLFVRLPADMESGSHHETLIVKFRAEGKKKLIHRQIDLTARVLRRLSIYGKEIDTSGKIDLGFIPASKGKTIRLRLKTNDQQPIVSKWNVKVFPKFCNVRVLPHPKKKYRDRGLSILEIKIPAGSPVGDYRNTRLGMIRLEPIHPRLQPLALSLSFVLIQSL